jgi:BFD-like [2Fe-2S] binding domain.
MGREKTVIICRCNDVTLDDVLIAINEGIDDFELLRKYLKIGFWAVSRQELYDDRCQDIC